MAFASENHGAVEPFGPTKTVFSRGWFTRTVARFKAEREARAAISRLSQYTDAQLADIGLKRSDLTPYDFAEIVDSRARALLRAYQ